jgi:hypothetical protein
MVLSRPGFRAAVARLVLPDPKTDAMVRARVLSVVAQWQKEDADMFWREAWTELTRVPAAERDDTWRRLALTPASHGDYAQYRELAQAHLDGLDQDFWRSQFLPAALAVAARNRDWLTFERWVAAWDALPEPMHDAHSACAIANMLGVRALDEGRLADAEAAMRTLLQVAPRDQFVTNADTSALPKRLRTEGKLVDLCDQFDEIGKRVDWRLLTK